MTEHWPAVSYERWGATCDTLHAHTQVLGKLAVELAPPEPELLHAALRLTTRGWETGLLPAPDGSGSLVVALDLHAHEAVVEHSRGSVQRVPLVPDRPVAEVTRDVLAAVARAGGAVRINPVPQEVPWNVPLDRDYEHARYDPGQVEEYFAAATQAALALAAFRAPYRGRSTPVNAWWGSFDPCVVMTRASTTSRRSCPRRMSTPPSRASRRTPGGGPTSGSTTESRRPCSGPNCSTTRRSGRSGPFMVSRARTCLCPQTSRPHYPNEPPRGW